MQVGSAAVTMYGVKGFDRRQLEFLVLPQLAMLL